MNVLSTPCDFHFDDAIAGFFEVPTDNARRILPKGIEPLEHCHGQSILAAMAFDFRGGHVGPYREVVLAILVAPLLDHGSRHPHSAMFPFLVGTDSRRAREHGTRHYHLPHYPRNVEVRFQRDSTGATAEVSEQDPILRLRVAKPAGIDCPRVERHYQVISIDPGGLYVAEVLMSGDNLEHEEEAGAIDLHAHEFTTLVDLESVSRWPFREQWMTGGTETFWPVRRVAR